MTNGHKITGGRIKIEKGEDLNNGGSWTEFGRTRGEVSVDPDVDTVEDDDEHGTDQTDVIAVNEQQSIEFGNTVVSTMDALDVGGLIVEEDGEERLAGSYDLGRDGDEGVRVSVYEDKEALEDDNSMVRLKTTNGVIESGGFSLSENDTSTGEITIHSRERIAIERDSE